MAVARRRGDVELVSVDSMTVYRDMDIGTAKPSAAARAEVPHHLLDLVDPAEEFTVLEFQAAARAGAGRHRPARPAGPAGRRHRPLPAVGRRRPRPPRSLAGGRGRARSRGRRARRRRRPPRPAGRPRPARRVADDDVEPAPHRPGPRGDDRRRPAVLVVRPRPDCVPADPVHPARAPVPAGRRRPADRRALRGAGWTHGLLDEVRGPGGPAGRALPHRPPGPRLPRAARPRRGRRPPRRLRRRGRPADPPVRPPAVGLVPPGPRIRWLDGDDPVDAVAAALR